MKKIFSIITLFALVLTSCNDAIDIEQPGTLLAENAFKTVEDLELGASGIYARLDNTSGILLNGLYSDELSIGIENGGQNLADYQFQITSNSGISGSIWRGSYITINRINKLLVAAENITPEAGEGQRYNNVKGELYAIRAYLHFNLITYFSTDYTDDSALGVIALDIVPSTTADLPRNTNGEVFTLINTDLTTATSLLSNVSSTTFISKDFVTALRARMAAYRGQYTLANQYATTLLAKYSISSSTQFFQMFADADFTEVIFSLERSIGDGYDGQGFLGGGWAGSIYAFSNTTINGGAFMEMSRSLYNKLDNDDVRKTRYIDPSSVINPNYATDTNPDNDILAIRKYPGSGGQNLLNDIKIFRVSEMLLIKAEALANNGTDLPGAAALIKQLRDKRYGTAQALPAYGSEQAALKDILLERRKELAFEGFRWVDIKRLGVKAGVSIDRDPADCSLYNACTLSNTDYRFTMPIPLSETDVAPALKAGQNPGY
jgi:hypothetical protein